MSTFQTQCSKCGHTLSPPTSKLGKTGPCPGCQIRIVLAKGVSHPESDSVVIETEPEPDFTPNDVAALKQLEATPQAAVKPERWQALPDPEPAPQASQPSPYAPVESAPAVSAPSKKNPYWAVQAIANLYQIGGMLWITLGVIAFIVMVAISLGNDGGTMAAGLFSAFVTLLGNMLIGTFLVAGGQMFLIILAIERNTRPA